MTFNEVIKEAIANNQKLEIIYSDSNGKSSTRQISNVNYSTAYQKNKNINPEYISAYCHLRNENRTFKINRIEKVRFVDRSQNTNWVENSSGCYIATMAYGSYEHPQVLKLRKFRDDILLGSYVGNLLVKFYYYLSPKLVLILKNNTTINKGIRKLLDKLIKTINI